LFPGGLLHRAREVSTAPRPWNRTCIPFSIREEEAMSFEITLKVNDLDQSGEMAPEPHEGVVKALGEMEGVLAVRYDPKSQRFSVGYDPHRVTILRILSRIEAAGKQAGRMYRPADVKTTGEPHHLAWNLQRSPNDLPHTPSLR
jgi:hypothetical protein